MLKTSLLLFGGLAVVGYWAYAVYAAGERAERKPLPAPSITRRPAKESKKAWARFSFKDHRHGVRFLCSLDGSKYKACRSPKRYPGPLTEGRHTFGVRATRKKGKSSRPASYTWSVEGNVEPQVSGESFSISAGVIPPLYPGAGPVSIPLTLSNPNDIPIYVTSLTVAVTSSLASCDSSSNLSITQTSASSAAPVLIEANGSVTLPAEGVAAPTIQFLDLAVNQDACMNATFPLSFTGSAHS